MPTNKTLAARAIRKIGVRLWKLKREARAIQREELILKARENLGVEGARGEIYRLMQREEKCFKELRAVRIALQDLCGHADRKWVGRDWFCSECGKIEYGAPLQTV